MKEDEVANIIKLVNNFNEEYWNSDIDCISIIDDLRLSTNLHETAHSRLLYKFLFAGKSCAFPFLKNFIEIVFPEKQFDEINSSKVKVHKEKINIDVLIEIGNKFIIIENKVNHARDQNRQIETYYEKVKENYCKEDENIYVIYLTRFDSDPEPSIDSLPIEIRNRLGKRYKKISYEKDISEWLVKCINFGNNETWKNKESINAALVQYKIFIDNMLNPYKNDNTMIEIIEKSLEIVDESDLCKQIERVENYKDDIDTIYDKLSKYAAIKVVQKLKEKKIESKAYNNDKIIFRVRVPFLDEAFTGIANIHKKNDGGYWYGLKIENQGGKHCLIKWKDGQFLPVNKKKENQLQDKIVTDKYHLADKDQINGISKEVYYYLNDIEHPVYMYWKYCDSIIQLIGDIEDYVKRIEMIK